jgi:hypothetical protein
MVHGIRSDELVRLTPRLKSYLRRPNPTWPEIIDAADWLRHDLDISKPLWGDARLTMGQDLAAVALAIVSTKNPEHFRTTPRGYFHGMVQRRRPASCTSSGQCGRCGAPLCRYRRHEAGRGGGRPR